MIDACMGLLSKNQRVLLRLVQMDDMNKNIK